MTQAITPDVARALFEASLDAVFICARGGTIVAANPAACRLFGMSEAQLRSEGFSSVTLHPKGAGGRLFEPLPLQKNTADLVFTRQDGGAFVGEVVVVPVGDARAVVIVRERSVAQMFGEAESFLRDLSHDLRTPLAAIRNTVYLMRHGEKAAADSRACDVIDRQVENVYELVEKVADLARLVRGKMKLSCSPVDVNMVVKVVADEFALLMQERGIVFGVMVPPCDVMVLGDPERINQIVASLLHLVLRRAGRHHAVTIDVAVAEQQVRISVRGRDADLDPAVFLPESGEGGEDSDVGAGVTRALLNGLVQLHGGTVAVSFAGGMELVVVSLPLLQGGAETEPAAATSQPRKKQVLVVDDDRDAADSLGAIVTMWGHQVAVAYDAPSALEVAVRDAPEVVLCDLNLCGMTGYEVAEAIRRREGENVLMVAISGNVEAANDTKAHRAGFDLHLTKPVDVEELRVVVEAHVRPPGGFPEGARGAAGKGRRSPKR